MLLRTTSWGPVARATIFFTAVAAPSFASAVASAAGLEASVRPGYGGAGSDSPISFEPKPNVIVDPNYIPGSIWGRTASPYGGGFAFTGGLGVRFGVVSFGIEGGTRSSSTTSPDPKITDMKRSAFFVGPYVHAYIPHVPFVDPWIGVGVQYVKDTQTFKAPAGQPPIPVDWTLDHHGVAIPITVGVDYSLLGKMLAIGPAFTYAPTFAAGGCANFSLGGSNGQSLCQNESDDRKRVTKANGYSSWNIALNLRFTFPPP